MAPLTGLPGQGFAGSPCSQRTEVELEGSTLDSEKALESRPNSINVDPSLQQDQTPKKTWKQNMSLWSGTPRNTNLLTLFIRPLPLIVRIPIIGLTFGDAARLLTAE